MEYGKIDPITFSVLDAGIRLAVAEMKAVVFRTAYSNLWREAGDLSCGMLLPNGDIVAQGVGDIPIHLASMSLTLKGIIADIPLDSIEPGDVLLQNDPYRGNNHMPDCFMAKPVFVQGKLICFTAVRGHYVDIGGPVAGSYNLHARDIYGEGMRIPPVKVMKCGKADREILSIISSNMRNPKERLGDMKSQYAGCNHAARRIADFCEEYSVETVESVMRMMLDHSEETARAALSRIPDGTYCFEDCCDGDGCVSEPLWIHCSLVVSDGNVTVDFTGTSKQCKGPMNSPFGVTYSAVCFAVKAVTEPHSPSNSGSYRPITVIAPEGTLVNPSEPAPVVAGNHETSSRIADVVLGCLANALPGEVPAAGTGSCTVLLVEREGKVDDSIMYEVHGAGQGGSPDHDGANARRTSIGNTGNTPNEILEMTHPVRIVSYSIRRDAAGAGEFRGGNGISRCLMLTEDAVITIAADRDMSRPYGIDGGCSGGNAVFELQGETGDLLKLSSKTASLSVPARSELLVECAAGGGFGRVDNRSLDAIQDDLDDGYISVEGAEQDYGVVCVKDSGRVEGEWLVVARKGANGNE